MSISAEEKDRSLREAGVVLAREDFHVNRKNTGGLCARLTGEPLCEAFESGGITGRNENIGTPERIAAKDKVYGIVRAVAEYMLAVSAHAATVVVKYKVYHSQIS